MSKRKLLLVSGIAVLVGGAITASVTFVQGESKPGGSHSVSNRPSADRFAALRARPLREPRLHSKSPCRYPQVQAVGLPASIPAEGALGAGAVHPVSRAIPRFLDFFPPNREDALMRSRWRSNETMWVSEPRYRGPVLVRGRIVRGSARVGFGSAIEPVWELRLPAGDWDEAPGLVRIWGKTIHPPKGWRVRKAFTRVRPRGRQGEACYFFQVDGKSFSETIEFGAIIQP